jgi:hypothetical protein
MARLSLDCHALAGTDSEANPGRGRCGADTTDEDAENRPVITVEGVPDDG